MFRNLDRDWLIILSIVFLSIFIRSYRINMPLLEGAMVRQIICADVSRNMYRDGEFLKPKISLLPEPNLLLEECPIYCFSVSIVYRIIGDIRESWGRIITILSFVVGMILLYLIVREYSDKKTALISMSVLSLLPVGVIYGKSFQPDQLSIAFGLLAIYMIIMWAKKENVLYFLISVVCLIVGSLTKLTTLSLLFTTLAIIVLKKRKESLRCVIVYSALVIAGISPWLLYIYNHKHLLTVAYAYAFSFDKWLSFERFLSYSYYNELFSLISGVVLTPIGFSLFLLGFIFKNRKNEGLIFHVWLISSFLPFVLLNKKFATHWFLLPLPVLSYFIGKAICNMKTVLNNVSSNIYYRCMLGGVIILCLAGYANSGFLIPKTVKNTLLISRLVKEVTKPDDVICVDSGRHLVYYSDRKGYAIYVDDSFISEIEKLAAKGVRYLIITRIEKYKSRAFLKDYIEKNYELIKEEEGICLIYRLY